MKAKKALGQNFLINENLIKNIVNLINPTVNDLVLEIGPGKGALTKYLSKYKSTLLCIEKDTDLRKFLSNYNVIYTDVLEANLKDILSNYKYNNLYIIGNLPYYITTPIMEHIIESNIKPNKCIFMVQKEVADRLTSLPGHKEYGYMTVYLKHFFDVNKEIFVSKNNFNPVPKVDSEIISLTSKNNFMVDNNYFNFIKECFHLKRKTLKNNLSNYDFSVIKGVLNKYNLNENIRSEELSEDVFIDLYNLLKKPN